MAPAALFIESDLRIGRLFNGISSFGSNIPLYIADGMNILISQKSKRLRKREDNDERASDLTAKRSEGQLDGECHRRHRQLLWAVAAESCLGARRETPPASPDLSSRQPR